jgi:hypothetical protein
MIGPKATTLGVIALFPVFYLAEEINEVMVEGFDPKTVPNWLNEYEATRPMQPPLPLPHPGRGNSSVNAYLKERGRQLLYFSMENEILNKRRNKGKLNAWPWV